MKKFTRIVDEFKIKEILEEFLSSLKYDTKMIIYYKISGRGDVRLFTNHPGLLIGRQGETINNIKERFTNEANVRNTLIYEMKRVVSNCGIY